NQEFSWGGGVGNVINNWLQNSLGAIGTAAVLGLIVIAYLIWQFNPAFSFPKKFIPQPLTVKEDESEEVPIATEPTKVEEKPATPEPKSNDNEAAKLIIDTGAEKPGYNFTLVKKQEELPQKQEEKGFENISVLKPSLQSQSEKESSNDEISLKNKAEGQQPMPGKTSGQSKSGSDSIKLEINSAPI
ncbi:MAG TPA: DNA translocase FtsK, partial [Niabella sp.]|nr:DNA translocase FtsK [Niabella sp.]